MEERQKERFGSIGGTAISAIIGENPYENKLSIYYRLRRECPDKEDSVAMERGRDFENIVAQTFGILHKNEFTVYHNDHSFEKNRADWTEQQRDFDSEFDFITGSPDRLLYPANVTEDQFNAGAIAGLEIKTASILKYNEWGVPGTDDIPLHYYCQCLWYLMLRPNVKSWHIAVQFFDVDGKPRLYQEYVINRTVQVDAMISRLREEGVKFWNEHVLPGVPPTIDAEEYGKIIEYVKDKNPKETEPLEEGTDEEQDVFERWKSKKEEYKRVGDELNALEAEMISKIGAREGLYFPNVGGKENKVTRKSQTRTTVEWKKVVDEANVSQELIDKHTKTTTSRVLRIGKF